MDLDFAKVVLEMIAALAALMVTLYLIRLSRLERQQHRESIARYDANISEMESSLENLHEKIAALANKCQNKELS